MIGGFAISALAMIAALLQFVQVKMTSPKPNPDDPMASTTSTMVYLFPLMTIFWGGLFPSGLILYWIVYTAFLVVQQYTIMGWGNLFPIFGWQPRWAPRARTRHRVWPRRARQPIRTMGPRTTGSPPPTAPPAPAPPATTASARAPGRDDDEAVDDDLQGIHR